MQILPLPHRFDSLLNKGLAVLFVVVLCLGARPGRAQDVSTYQFAASSGTFVPITAATGATTIALLAQDNAVSQQIALPFPFYYGGTLMPSLTATSEGYLDFTSNRFSYNTNNFGGNGRYVAPLWDDLSGAGGTASYVVSGTAPNRVFVFQWLNWRWNNTSTAANISFQARLYEGSNVIQFVYRPEAGAFSSANASATIGLDGAGFYGGSGGNFRNYISLADASASPALASNLYPAGASVNGINTRPAAGQTYTFTPINDFCGHATPLVIGTTISGSTLDATTVDDPSNSPSCSSGIMYSASAGVFYSVRGNGQTMTVSTCAGTSAAGGNTQIVVYRGTCDNRVCLGSNNDLGSACGTNPQASGYTFATQTGQMYYILVQFAQTGATGPFGLRLTATGLAARAALGAGSIDVFPNPAQRAFTLRLPALANERSAQVVLLNGLGQQVRSQALALNPGGTQTQVDVSGLAAGLYTVRVLAGNQAATRQLLVE